MTVCQLDLFNKNFQRKWHTLKKRIEKGEKMLDKVIHLQPHSPKLLPVVRITSPILVHKNANFLSCVHDVR